MQTRSIGRHASLHGEARRLRNVGITIRHSCVFCSRTAGLRARVRRAARRDARLGRDGRRATRGQHGGDVRLRALFSVLFCFVVFCFVLFLEPAQCNIRDIIHWAAGETNCQMPLFSHPPRYDVYYFDANRKRFRSRAAVGAERGGGCAPPPPASRVRGQRALAPQGVLSPSFVRERRGVGLARARPPLRRAVERSSSDPHT